MSTEQNKPVRTIDTVAWRPKVSMLTKTDKEAGLNIIRCTLRDNYRPTLVQWQFLESLTLAQKVTDKFIHRMVSQPK